MNEKGWKPYMYPGLSYNQLRDVVPARKREWDGYIIPQLEMKKPNQYPESGKKVKLKTGSGYPEMIYTYDLQCMKSPYPTSRHEASTYVRPSFDAPDLIEWEPEEITETEVPTKIEGRYTVSYSLNGSDWVDVFSYIPDSSYDKYNVDSVEHHVSLEQPTNANVYFDDLTFSAPSSASIYSDTFTGNNNDPPDSSKWTLPTDSMAIENNTLSYYDGGGPG